MNSELVEPHLSGGHGPTVGTAAERPARLATGLTDTQGQGVQDDDRGS